MRAQVTINYERKKSINTKYYIIHTLIDSNMEKLSVNIKINKILHNFIIILLLYIVVYEYNFSRE